MPAIRLILLGAVVVALSACGTDSPPRAYSLVVVGCGVAEIRPSPTPQPMAIDATIRSCVGAADPVGRVARAVWLSRSGAIESLQVRVAGPRSPVTVLSRIELAARYGDLGGDGRRSASFLWLLLLGLPAAAAILIAVVARHSRFGVVVLFPSR